MDWFKKHADTIVILGSFALCFWTLNEKMNDKFDAFNEKMNGKFVNFDEKMNERLIVIEKDIAIIKTVLFVKNILPSEYAAQIPEK